MLLRSLLAVTFGMLVGSPGARAAEMSVSSLKMMPGSVSDLKVSGAIDGEETFGWRIMISITPRGRTTGTVRFTNAPAEPEAPRAIAQIRQTSSQMETVELLQAHRTGVDIVQLEDVWSDRGSFSAFDTDLAGAREMNGAVDDNGTFVPESVAYVGRLARFPVAASADARGVWEVKLYTSVGESGWEGVSTLLTGGTIRIGQPACSNNNDCNDGDSGTTDACDAGTCRYDKAIKAMEKGQAPERRSTKTRRRMRR